MLSPGEIFVVTPFVLGIIGLGIAIFFPPSKMKVEAPEPDSEGHDHTNTPVIKARRVPRLSGLKNVGEEEEEIEESGIFIPSFLKGNIGGSKKRGPAY